VAVAVLPVVRAALADANRRWPEIQWSCAAEAPAADRLFVELPGGPDALRRLLDPLLANAAEGDGTFGASQVEVRVRGAGEAVELELDDDGPGFAAHLLHSPIALLASAKPRGSGLGIYTVERRARSVGGSLARDNRPEGGARVALTLPAAPRRGARRDSR
jgi:C4-dicarboxylate-specific signal transduction histidine kinase